MRTVPLILIFWVFWILRTSLMQSLSNKAWWDRKGRQNRGNRWEAPCCWGTFCPITGEMSSKPRWPLWEAECDESAGGVSSFLGTQRWRGALQCLGKVLWQKWHFLWVLKNGSIPWASRGVFRPPALHFTITQGALRSSSSQAHP